jgi:molybdopterin synthase sulfur carrier subunit
MGVSVKIPTPLRSLTNGQAEVSVEGKTVKEVIENLERDCNGIKARICDEQGNLRRFVNLYLNDEDIRFLQNLDTVISDGDGLSIIPAIAGG